MQLVVYDALDSLVVGHFQGEDYARFILAQLLPLLHAPLHVHGAADLNDLRIHGGTGAHFCQRIARVEEAIDEAFVSGVGVEELGFDGFVDLGNRLELIEAMKRPGRYLIAFGWRC